MPKVGKETYSFGRFTGVHFDYEIHFTKGKESVRGLGGSKAHFFAKVPENILVFKPDRTTISGATYDEAKAKAKEYFDEFYSKGVTQKKIIIYFLDWTTPRKFIEEPTYEGVMRADIPFNGFSLNRDHPRQELRLDFRIKWLVNVGGNDFLSDDEVHSPNDLNGGINMSNPNHDFNRWKIMDYNPEAEEWFKTTVAALGKLIAVVHAFFGNDPQQLLESIEKKKLIFGSTQETKNEKTKI